MECSWSSQTKKSYKGLVHCIVDNLGGKQGMSLKERVLLTHLRKSLATITMQKGHKQHESDRVSIALLTQFEREKCLSTSNEK